MAAPGTDSSSFSWLAAGVVHRLEHGVGHEVVLLSVDEEHGQGGLFQLFHAGGFLKAVSGPDLAHQGGGVEQGEGGQAEHLLELELELIPHRGVAAVFDDAFHVAGQLLPGHHHHRGAPHGHAEQQDLGPPGPAPPGC